jgi:DNA-binding transcriptional ArsR family regulator
MVCYCPRKWQKFFKAVCDKQRQKILEVLRSQKILNASQIRQKVNLSQPTISHHLKILGEASLVRAKRKGKEVYYSINEGSIVNCCSGFMGRFSLKYK